MSITKLWAEVNEAELEGADKEMTSSSGGEFMKLDVGKNIVRFLPPLAEGGDTTPVKVIFEHFVDGVGSDGGTFRFVCPRKQMRGKGLKCPLCDHADRLRTSGNVLDNKKAKKMYSSQRMYTNVINRKAPELGPRILSFGKTIWEQLKEIRSDDEGGIWWNPGPKGFDINIHRTGKGKMDTEYTVRIGKRGSLSEDEDQIVEWAERMPNLGSFAQLMDPDELVAALGAEIRADSVSKRKKALRDNDDDDDDDDADRPKQIATGKIKKPKQTAQESIDEDEDELSSVDDDDDVPY
jgi:hypothetical protein